jgi:N-acetylmuramoyl-L-alanine amidase
MRPLIAHVRRAGLQAVAGVIVALICAMPAEAQSAAAMYERAQEREQAARASSATLPDSFRAVARAYEAIVRRFPGSGYSDNALWQAAGLMKLAFAKSGDAADRQSAERFLTWLRREYPASSFVADAQTQLAALNAPTPPRRPAAAVTGAASPPPRATAVDPGPAAPPQTGSSPAPATGAAAPAQGPSALIQNITQTLLPRGERVVIELSREVVYAGERVQGPDRVFVDFTNATAAAALVQRAQKLNGALVRGVRIGRHTTGVTRVVLELAGAPRYSTFPLYNPFRLVVDVEAETIDPTRAQSAPAATKAEPPKADPPRPDPPRLDPPKTDPPRPDPVITPPPSRSADPPVSPPRQVDVPPDPVPATPKPAPPAITSRGEYSLARQLGLGVARVVIDAGHGGHDPGAQANGINEAELVLDVALRLEKLLLDHEGVDVVLTRRTDEFIPLEERTAIANREKADLFLSIHANASRRADARGIETYFLNFATNPDAEIVAARENATSGQTMGTLPAILRAIALNNKLDESRELASIVQTHLIRKLRVPNKAVRDLGVKQAPFVVLIGAQMPSVLAEISFVTNKPEASLLKQAAYRQQIAQALYDGIVKYQASLKKVTTASQQR